MNILGLIPARGGSKAVLKKNIALLAGKPLLAYTCEAALSSQRLTTVLLNTDDPEIAYVGQACGVAVPFTRPESLAEDDTPILPVIQHTLNWLQENQALYIDIVVLLQPTSPLREAKHIDAALEQFIDSNADTLVSVVSVPHNFNPVSVMDLNEDGYLTPFVAGSLILRRQDKPKVYARNGPAILAVRRDVIQNGRLYGDAVLPFEMDSISSIDIDTADDLALAEFWHKRLHESNPI